ncbi:MAG: protein tyrosine phosphatase [Roseomonas sp.]|nr:protein tyrosine phosphatase [Roseomonas sp.]
MLRGRLELPLDGRLISISGGPFDAMPQGARGLCLEARAARVAEAEWQLDVPDFGLPDEAGLRTVLTQMLEAMRAAPDGAYHIGCKAGIGRTGTVMACLAIMAGAAEGDPVSWLRAAYNAEAIETPGQEEFVRRFARAALAP